MSDMHPVILPSVEAFKLFNKAFLSASLSDYKHQYKIWVESFYVRDEFGRVVDEIFGPCTCSCKIKCSGNFYCRLKCYCKCSCPTKTGCEEDEENCDCILIFGEKTCGHEKTCRCDRSYERICLCDKGCSDRCLTCIMKKKMDYGSMLKQAIRMDNLDLFIRLYDHRHNEMRIRLNNDYWVRYAVEKQSRDIYDFVKKLMTDDYVRLHGSDDPSDPEYNPGPKMALDAIPDYIERHEDEDEDDEDEDDEDDDDEDEDEDEYE